MIMKKDVITVQSLVKKYITKEDRIVLMHKIYSDYGQLREVAFSVNGSSPRGFFLLKYYEDKPLDLIELDNFSKPKIKSVPELLNMQEFTNNTAFLLDNTDDYLIKRLEENGYKICRLY